MRRGKHYEILVCMACNRCEIFDCSVGGLMAREHSMAAVSQMLKNLQVIAVELAVGIAVLMANMMRSIAGKWFY